MKERIQQPLQNPLFDEIPQGLKHLEQSIKETFDGSIGNRAITMILNPLTGQVVRARLVNLETGSLSSYEPLARGRWSNPQKDLKEDSSEYKKLDMILNEVYKKFEDWKYTIRPASFPLREWTTVTGLKTVNPFDNKIVSYKDWYDKFIKPLTLKVKEEDGEVDDQREEKTRERKLKRTWLSSNATSVKENVRALDKKPALSRRRTEIIKPTARAR